MQLEAALRLSIAGFPSLTLLVEAFKPLVGLGVETFGEDVVALLVVGVGHAVLRRVELFGVVLVGLLQRQGDPAALQVDVDDLHHGVFVGVDNLIRHLNVALSQFGDVNQTLDAFFDPHECAERHQLGDLAGHNLANSVGAGENAPRIFLGCLERQGYPLAVQIHIQHLDGYFVADSNNLGRVIDVLPRQLGNVNQAVDPAQVHEGTKVDDGGHHALAHLALLQLVQEFGTHLGLGLLQPSPARQNNVVALFVEFDDFGFDLLADVGVKVADAAHFDEGCGQEAAQSDVEDEAAFDDFDDGASDGFVFFFQLFDSAPCAFVLCALLGEDQSAFFVFFGEDEGVDLIAHFDDFVWVDVVFDGELAYGDDAFGLVSDVEQDLVVIDFHHGAFNDVAVVEVFDGGVDGCEEFLRAANVVNGNLGGFIGGHMLGAPNCV